MLKGSFHEKSGLRRYRPVVEESSDPFLFIKVKRLVILLKKNALICYQRAMLPIHSGVTALCR